MSRGEEIAGTSRLHACASGIGLGGAAVAAIVFLIVGDLFAAFGFAAVAILAGWEARRLVWSVRLDDGYLSLRYLYRHRIVRLAEVRRIRFIPGRGGEGSRPPMFEVTLGDDSKFRVVANASTRPMMESMVRQQPLITVDGSIW